MTGQFFKLGDPCYLSILDAFKIVKLPGTIWGITHEKEPLYDVMLEDGTVKSNLSANTIKRATGQRIRAPKQIIRIGEEATRV